MDHTETHGKHDTLEHHYAGEVLPWPRELSVRIPDHADTPVLMMALGNVKTPATNALFDPEKDSVTFEDKTTVQNYFKTRLGVPYYQPIDKSVFPVPPSGWCSWYYYYTEIDPQEILANAEWIARNLKPFGAEYVQIDDGWQGVGRGWGDNRDWFELDVRFQEKGMKDLAEKISTLGLTPGIWLAPHGQSNKERVDRYGCFLKKPDGTSASATWEGDWLLDPSLPGTHEYLRDLFSMLMEWGYRYYKIDGQPIVIDEYEKKREYYGGSTAPSIPDEKLHDELYRNTLQTIRSTIGEDSYLLGCWGYPLPGIGIMNGSRTSGDVIQGWPGFLLAARAVQEWNFLHNIAWYCDPDVFMVRPPLSEGIARAWATIQGLTGQALLTSDRLMDLPPERVEMLRRIYPAVDVRPIDLYRANGELKTIWDLKINHLGRSYDVVGLFNFNDQKVATHHLRWQDVGLNPETRYEVYDFWQGVYLGAWEQGVFIDVPPADVRVITLVPRDENKPQLISTSRHITQGWVDLLSCESTLSEDGSFTIRGRSSIVSGDPYSLVFSLPIEERAVIHSAAGKPLDRDASWRLETVKIEKEATLHTINGIGYAQITIDCVSKKRERKVVEWECRFVRDSIYHFPVAGPEKIDVLANDKSSAEIRWDVPYLEHSGYEVQVDGKPVGVAFNNRAKLQNLEQGKQYQISVKAVWMDGSGAQKPASVDFQQP